MESCIPAYVADLIATIALLIATIALLVGAGIGFVAGKYGRL